MPGIHPHVRAIADKVRHLITILAQSLPIGPRDAHVSLQSRETTHSTTTAVGRCFHKGDFALKLPVRLPPSKSIIAPIFSGKNTPYVVWRLRRSTYRHDNPLHAYAISPLDLLGRQPLGAHPDF